MIGGEHVHSFLGIAEVSARAGIQGAGEHELCGIGQRDHGPGNRDEAILKRLAQDFQDMLLELGQLVQKENAMVCKRDLARPRVGSAPDQAGVRDGVVRGTKGPDRHQGGVRRQQSGHRVDLGGFDGFVQGQVGEDGGQTAG